MRVCMTQEDGVDETAWRQAWSRVWSGASATHSNSECLTQGDDADETALYSVYTAQEDGVDGTA